MNHLNNPYRYQIRTVNVTMAIGQSEASKTIQLEKGQCIMAAAKVATDPDNIINLGLFESGQEINTPIDVRFWRDKEIGNNHFDGYMPVGTEGGSEVEAKLISPSGNVTAAVNVQIVFVIVQERIC